MGATLNTMILPNSKYVDYGSTMANGNHTRLYLKATTIEYLTGKGRWSVPRFGGAGRTFIMDYYHIYGTVNIDLRTYTTHEAIWTNAHSVMLEIKH